MNTSQIKQLMMLRAAVGLLGEEQHPGWWDSTFCGANGKAFLAPVFPRTYVLAQLQGVTAAAASVHDDRIGVGNVFHLFRLPEELEQELYRMVSGKVIDEVAKVMRSVDAATQLVSDIAASACKEAIGPVKVGDISSLQMAASWREVASLYLRAFEDDKMIFPFFSDMA